MPESWYVQLTNSSEFLIFIAGIGFSDGHIWRVHRRFSLSVLKDLGFGKSKTEAIVQTELEHLCKQVAATGGLPFSPKIVLTTTATNVITSVVFDERCGEDPEFENMIDNLNGFLSTSPRSLFMMALWP